MINFQKCFFSDTTGNRRFFPIRAKARLNWDTVNVVTWLLLWRSIDNFGLGSH
uniref:hypothetical protein n=1 Tax=Azospirillum argentinense TaxID=2970906 RepID=UPI0015863459|nr:hypothetical protein [Azospirillum argentinense]